MAAKTKSRDGRTAALFICYMFVFAEVRIATVTK